MTVRYLVQENGDQILLEVEVGSLILSQGVLVGTGDHARQVISPVIDAMGWGEDRRTKRVKIERYSILPTSAKIMRHETVHIRSKIKTETIMPLEGKISREDYKSTTAKILRESQVKLSHGRNDADKNLIKKKHIKKMKEKEIEENPQNRKQVNLKDSLREFIVDEDV